MGGGGIMLVVRFGGGANEAGSLSCEIGVALWPLAARSPSSRRKTPVTCCLKVVPSFSGCQPLLKTSLTPAILSEDILPALELIKGIILQLRLLKSYLGR